MFEGIVLFALGFWAGMAVQKKYGSVGAAWETLKKVFKDDKPI